MGGQSAPTTTQTSTTKLGPEQEQVFKMALPYINQYASQPIQQFAGSGIAPFNPLETQAQGEYVNQAAPAVAALGNQGAATQSQLLDPNFMLNPNQYVGAAGQAVADTTTKNLMENILPGVKSGATMAGGPYSGGSTREGVATGKAIGDTGRDISNSLADMYFKNYTTGLSGLGEALNRNPSVQQQLLMPEDIKASVGAQQRSMQQAQLDEQVKKFYTGQELPLIQGQTLLQLIQGMPGATTMGTATGAVPQSSPMMQALGLGATALGYGMGGPIGGAIGKGAAGAIGGAK
jgi:hypothetical protein